MHCCDIKLIRRNGDRINGGITVVYFILELSFIKGAVNQDILLQSLKSASSTDNILDLVSAHHKIMNNKHLMQAFRSLFVLQKSGRYVLILKKNSMYNLHLLTSQ